MISDNKKQRQFHICFILGQHLFWETMSCLVHKLFCKKDMTDDPHLLSPAYAHFHAF